MTLASALNRSKDLHLIQEIEVLLSRWFLVYIGIVLVAMYFFNFLVFFLYFTQKSQVRVYIKSFWCKLECSRLLILLNKFSNNSLLQDTIIFKVVKLLGAFTQTAAVAHFQPLILNFVLSCRKLASKACCNSCKRTSTT